MAKIVAGPDGMMLTAFVIAVEGAGRLAWLPTVAIEGKNLGEVSVISAPRPQNDAELAEAAALGFIDQIAAHLNRTCAECDHPRWRHWTTCQEPECVCFGWDPS